MLLPHATFRIGLSAFLVVVVAVATAPPAAAHLVSTGSLGPLYLGPSDTASFNTDTGQYTINGGPPIPGGVHDANGAMVFNFTTIELHNTTPITAYGANPLALASIGPVNIAGPINLRGCTPATCGTVIIAGGGKNGAAGNVIGQGGNGGTGGQNGQFLPGGQGGFASGPGAGGCPNANGGAGGGGGGGFSQPFKGTGGNGAVTGGGGGGEGGANGNSGANGVMNNPGAGGSGGSATGGDGGNGNANGGAAMNGFNGVPALAGGGGGGGGGGAIAVGNGGNGGNGGVGGGGGGGGGGTKCGNQAGKGGSGGGGYAIAWPFAGLGPFLGGGGGGGAGGKSKFGIGTYAPSGGGGGGAIAIDSLTSIEFMAGGLIDARGSDASPPGSMGDGAGGGGGGGAICLAAPVVNGALPGSNLRVEGGADSQGLPGINGVVTVELIASCDPDDDIVATTSCQCSDPGATITFTLHNNSASSIYLMNSAPIEIRNTAGQVVYRPACVLWPIIEIPAGQSQNFTWDQKDWGDQTLNGCQWNNAAQVANGNYTFAVSFCTDAQCTNNQQVRCVGFKIGNCASVTTDKDCYAPGEHVTITITNNGCSLINLRNLMPWKILDAVGNLVYQPACVAWMIVPLNPGESYTFTLGDGGNNGTTWDQLDDGNAQVGCGYQNRAQVANGTYQACATYTDATFGPNTTVCSTFKIANNCVAVDPDCPCNMLGAPARLTITNGSSQPIGLPNQQAWRIRNLAGDLVYAPPPSGPPVQLNPNDTYSVYWDQNDQQGQPAPSGDYDIEFDYIEMPSTPRIARGRLQLGGCLKMTLDQDCYAPGADVKIKVVNTSCQQLRLTLCDVGPVQVFDNQDVPVWAYPCDTACNNSRIMQPGEMRSWTWNQKDEGNGTVTNCLWNNAQQVPNGRYCAKVPYADVNFLRGFTAQQCLDIGAGCADLTADKNCYETGDQTCFTLSNNTGGAITVDRPWRILDAGGSEVHPGAGCFIFWIPIVIADGSCRQFCWDQQVCFTPPLVAPGAYTFEVHFTEADGSAHTYLQAFQIVAAGQCYEDFIFCDGFEDGNIADWTVTTTGNGIIAASNVVSKTGAWSLHMNSPNQGDRADAVTPAVVATQLDFTQPYSVSFDFRLPHLNYHFFEVLSINKSPALGNSQVLLVMDTPGVNDLIYRDGTGNHAIVALAANQWYNFSVSVRPAAGQYDVSIDNGATAQVLNIPFAGAAGGTGFTGVRVGDRNSDATLYDYGEAYWDNLCIQGKRLVADCNNNGIPDDQDIAGGYSLDCNGNDIPDECEYSGGCVGLLTGDMTCDGNVDGRDISKFLEYVLAGRYTCQADINQDGVVSLPDVQPLVDKLLCWPNCPVTGPSVRSDRFCYLSGETAVAYVDMPPTTSGSLNFRVYLETDDGNGTMVYEETRPLNGSATYTFSATLPQVGTFDAVARWLDGGGQEIAVDGLALGARPNLPQIPADLCTFETFTVSASALRSQVEAAVANQTPMPLPIGSRSFEVLLESNNEIVDPQTFVDEPTLAFFRGRIACNPDSAVRLTFVRGLVNALVDQGTGEVGVYMEPAYVHDPSLPFDLYVGYRSGDVRIPMQPDVLDSLIVGGDDSSMSAPSSIEAAGGKDQSGGNEAVQSSTRVATKSLNVYIYYDNDPNGSRFTHWNNITSTFLNRFSSVLRSTTGGFPAGINTNAYNDDPGFIDSFRTAVGNPPAGYDLNLLFTDNPTQINYGNVLGRGYWIGGQYRGANMAHLWVRRTGSNHQIRIVGLHEISHVLGASNTTSAHRDNVIRRDCHLWGPLGIICWSWHDHYSLMRSSYSGDAAADDNWLNSDKTTLTNTFNNAPGTNAGGHFGNP